MNKSILDDYRKQGYVVLENFISAPFLLQLRERALVLSDEIIKGVWPTVHPQEQSTWSLDPLEETTRKYCCFWEQPKTTSSRLLKVTHALHKLDPLFREVAYSSQIKNLLKRLSLKQPQIVQSQLHFKPAHSASSVAWHQDASYIMTSPCTTTGLWLALEDATLENGCITQLYAKLTFYWLLQNKPIAIFLLAITYIIV